MLTRQSIAHEDLFGTCPALPWKSKKRVSLAPPSDVATPAFATSRKNSDDCVQIQSVCADMGKPLRPQDPVDQDSPQFFATVSLIFLGLRPKISQQKRSVWTWARTADKNSWLKPCLVKKRSHSKRLHFAYVASRNHSCFCFAFFWKTAFSCLNDQNGLLIGALSLGFVRSLVFPCLLVFVASRNRDSPSFSVSAGSSCRPGHSYREEFLRSASSVSSRISKHLDRLSVVQLSAVCIHSWIRALAVRD